MEEVYKRLFQVTTSLLDVSKNKSFEIYQDMLKIEKNLYDNLDTYALDEFSENAVLHQQLIKTEFHENFELAMYDLTNGLIMRRIINMLDKYLSTKPIGYKQMAKLDDNLYISMKNIEGCYFDLSMRLFANIETKFLYFLLLNNDISQEKKSTIFSNMIFVNPYLQEKIFSKTIMLEPFIKNEDELYFNLWQNSKDYYAEYLFDLCENEINNNINAMVSDVDIDDPENTIVRQTYLRTLFNYLDAESLEDLNDNFSNSGYEIKNRFGFDNILKAFNSVNKDNEIIRKIKVK